MRNGRSLVQAYTQALEVFLKGGGESVRLEAYQIGRDLAAAGHGLLDLAEIHRDALNAALPAALEARGCIDASKLSTSFFSEAASSFEMLLRGYRETAANLRELNETLESRVEERTRALAEAEARNLQAQKEETIGRLAGGIAHDFNNLLTVILGCSDLVLTSGNLDSRIRSEVQEARQAAERAAALTRQLLAFSRRQVLEPRVVDLHDTFQELERMLRRLIRSDIELECHLVPDLSPIRADPAQIEQVIVNLVVNARDAMPDGGTIVITMENIAEHDLKGPAEDVGVDPEEFVSRGAASVRISVSDTGEGMTDEVRARLFEPFFTTKTEGHGTGLGLATSRGIVEQSGGFMRVDSQMGAGTRFEVYLPGTSEPLSDPSIIGKPIEDRVAEGRTVLVVDDDEGLRRVVKRVLEGHGYQVLEARTGAGALDLLSEHAQRIDLLLTDVMLPGIRGPELASQAREEWPGLPTLLTTGYADAEILSTLQGQRVLHKPFRSAELLKAVGEAVG